MEGALSSLFEGKQGEVFARLYTGELTASDLSNFSIQEGDISEDVLKALNMTDWDQFSREVIEPAKAAAQEALSEAQKLYTSMTEIDLSNDSIGKNLGAASAVALYKSTSRYQIIIKSK